MKFGKTYNLLGIHKTMTSRVPADKWYKWYKDVNYTQRVMMAEGDDGEKRPIRLTFCTQQKLGWVKTKYFWEEGCSSPAAFEELWKSIYKKFDPELIVCTLTFEVIPLKDDAKK